MSRAWPPPREYHPFRGYHPSYHGRGRALPQQPPAYTFTPDRQPRPPRPGFPGPRAAAPYKRSPGWMCWMNPSVGSADSGPGGGHANTGAILNKKDTKGTIVSKEHPDPSFVLTPCPSHKEFRPKEDMELTVISEKEKAIRVRTLNEVLVKTRSLLKVKEVEEETKKKKEAALAKPKWKPLKPVSSEVPSQEIDVLEDISKEMHEGTLLKAILKHETAEGANQAIESVTPAKLVGANKEQKLAIKLSDPTTNVTDQGKPGEDRPDPAGCKDTDSSQRRYQRSRSSSNSPVQDQFRRHVHKKPRSSSGSRSSRRDKEGGYSSSRERTGAESNQRRYERSRSSSPVQDQFGRHVHKKPRSSSSSRSRSREKERTGGDSSLPPDGSRHGAVDEEIARKKRELEELSKMIVCHKAMVAMEPRGGMMDMKPTEKTCIDYGHGRIAVPATEYKPMKSILKKRNNDLYGPPFPIQTEPCDRDQYCYNPPRHDHIQSLDSPERSHLSYTQTFSKRSYYDEPPYEQTSAQHSSYQTQSPQDCQAPIHTQSAYQPASTQPLPRQTPPSQPPPRQTTPSQLSPRQMPPEHPPAPQTPPYQPPPSKSPSPSPSQTLAFEEKCNLTTQISRFLNILNKGVDANLLSTAVKETQDEIAVIAEKIPEPPQRYCELRTGEDEYRDRHRSREAEAEHSHGGFGREQTPEDHDDLRTTDFSQDDLLPHESPIQDSSVFSRIVGMQEQHSRGAYRRETSMDKDEQFLYGGKAPPAEGEHYKRSSGSAGGHKRDRDGRRSRSPTRETRGDMKSKSEHFYKIQSVLRTIGLDLDMTEVSELAERAHRRKREKVSSEHSDRKQGHSSSTREDRHWSRTGSDDSEHLQSISLARSPSQEPYHDHQHTSEYQGFLVGEKALEQVSLMQSLTKTARNTPEQATPITPTPTPSPSTSSSSQYPQELFGTSYSSTPYAWHQEASTQYSMPLSSSASSLGHQAPATYPPAGYPAYAGPSDLPTHYYGQPPVVPPPVSSYARYPLTGAHRVLPSPAKPPQEVMFRGSTLSSPFHKSIHQKINTLVTLSTPTSDTSKQTVATATVSTRLQCLKVIETVQTETALKEAPEPEAPQPEAPQPEAQVVQYMKPTKVTTESMQALPGTEEYIKAKQKKKLEQFNLRMRERTRQLFDQRILREGGRRDRRKVNLGPQNNPPGKVICTKPKNIWICGHSLVYWAEMRAKSPEVGMQLGMDPSSVVVWWKGTQGMTWPQLLPQLLQLKIKWPNPDVVIMHLGGNDLGTDSLSELLAAVKKDLTSMRSIFPQCLLVWSDILPRKVWRNSKDSLEMDLVRATINRRVHSVIAELGGTALTHNNIMCGTDLGLYRPDGVHLSGKGIDTYNLNLQDFLEKWEMEANPPPEQELS